MIDAVLRGNKIIEKEILTMENFDFDLRSIQEAEI